MHSVKLFDMAYFISSRSFRGTRGVRGLVELRVFEWRPVERPFLYIYINIIGLKNPISRGLRKHRKFDPFGHIFFRMIIYCQY